MAAIFLCYRRWRKQSSMLCRNQSWIFDFAVYSAVLQWAELEQFVPSALLCPRQLFSYALTDGRLSIEVTSIYWKIRRMSPAMRRGPLNRFHGLFELASISTFTRLCSFIINILWAICKKLSELTVEHMNRRFRSFQGGNRNRHGSSIFFCGSVSPFHSVSAVETKKLHSILFQGFATHRKFV